MTQILLEEYIFIYLFTYLLTDLGQNRYLFL